MTAQRTPLNKATDAYTKNKQYFADSGQPNH
jgi:hypothetical protein